MLCNILKLAIVTVITNGCVSATLSEVTYGPPKGGKARYLNQGMDAVIEARRKDAYSVIDDYCGSDGYHLTGEGTDDQLAGSWEYKEIAFTCGE